MQEEGYGGAYFKYCCRKEAVFREPLNRGTAIIRDYVDYYHIKLIKPAHFLEEKKIAGSHAAIHTLTCERDGVNDVVSDSVKV